MSNQSKRYVDQYSVERLIDRQIIQDLMFKWCRAVDRLDYEAIRAVFQPDAIDRHGPYEGGVDGLIEWVRERHANIPFSMHLVSNQLIEFADADTALSETYIWVVQRYDAEAGQSLTQITGGQSGGGNVVDLVAASRYIDRFEHRDGRWAVAQRNLSSGWRQMSEVPDNVPKMMPGWLVQQRDQDDFIFQERKRLGIA